jgi:hypothetical protein
MPAVSKKQQRFFGYLLSNPDERKKRGISKKAAKDFAQDVSEVAPPGWGHTKAEKEKTKPWKPKSKIGGSAAAFKRALDDGRFKGLPGSTTKKEKTADMFKLMWSMKKKGDKPHYKPGTDEKKKKYQEESLSLKDTKKLKKASVLSTSNDPKDQDRARARQVEIDYKDLMRQRKKGKVGVGKSMREERTSYYKDDRRSGRRMTYHDFYKKAQEAKSRKQSSDTRSDTRKHGVKFTDAKGSGRIRDGKKYYD